MSLKNLFRFSVVVALGLCLGGGLMAWMQNQNKGRTIASENWRPLPIGKHLAPVTVQIKTPDSLPDSDNQEVEITGYITLNVASDQDLHFQWSLPEGVTVVDGETADAWPQVKQGQTAITKISVIGFSREHRRLIGLEGFIQMKSNRLGNSATIASSQEGTLEEVAPALMQAKQDAESQDGKARRK